MKISHIKGLLIQEFFITLRSYEVILDIFVFPAMSTIVFGFLAVFLAGTVDTSLAYSFFVGMLFWQIIFVVQYSTSVSTLWNVWSRNLSNMFIAPVYLPEYIFAQILSAAVKACVIFILTSFLAIPFFHFNIYSLGMLNIFLYVFNLMLFAIALGFVILGLIFRFGTRIQAFAWGLLPIFQPFTAAFYPVSVLPAWMHPITYALSPTYIFEAIRTSLVTPGIQWHLIGISFGINIVYCIFAGWFFTVMFNKSKEKGQFARLEG